MILDKVYLFDETVKTEDDEGGGFFKKYGQHSL